MWISHVTEVKTATVSIEVRVIFVQWPCNCVPTVERYQNTFTLLLSMVEFQITMLPHFCLTAVAR
jgi:hypothetical protein